MLSHHTAAELDGLTDRASDIIHVTIGHDRRVSISGRERHELAPRIVVHRSRRIDAAQHPARTPPRTRIEETVLDLTQLSNSFDEVFSWLSRGCGRRLVTPRLLRAALIMRGRVRWHDEILDALPLIADGAHSNLEYRYVRDVERAHGLPEAKRQVKQVKVSRETAFPRSRYLDNLYEPFGVAVELDGAAYHLVEDRWRDIRKDNASATSGIVTLRFSWADVTRRTCMVAADVASALRQRGWTGLPSRCGPACVVPASLAGNNLREYDGNSSPLADQAPWGGARGASEAGAAAAGEVKGRRGAGEGRRGAGEDGRGAGEDGRGAGEDGRGRAARGR